MTRALTAQPAANGGFPLPGDDVPMREVGAIHDACGERTRVKLPSAVPARAVRRLRCDGCDQDYETDAVAELEGPRRGLRLSDLDPRRLGFDPSARTWRWASVAIGAAAVVLALMLIQGGGTSRGELPAPIESAASPLAAAGAEKPVPSGAAFVRSSNFSLALPAGWERVAPEGGATFAAVARDGGADATLWIERDPALDFATFEARSLDQLRSLAGSAQVVERIAAPTPEGTIVRLAADAPAGEPEFAVTLRAAGPYRYYLATTAQPDASARALEGTEVIQGTFNPEVTGAEG